jgi:hypothetical protein
MPRKNWWIAGLLLATGTLGIAAVVAAQDGLSSAKVLPPVCACSVAQMHAHLLMYNCTCGNISCVAAKPEASTGEPALFCR